MDDGDALLAAILAAPDEDTPRLAYADWLDEHGDPERAEFIRVQIEAACGHCYYGQMTPGRWCDSVRGADGPACRYHDLIRRGLELLGDRVLGGTEWPPGFLSSLLFADWRGSRVGAWARLTRGFVGEVEVEAEPWVAWWGDAVTGRHPVRRCSLLTTPAVTGPTLELGVGGATVVSYVLQRDRRSVARVAVLREVRAEQERHLGWLAADSPGRDRELTRAVLRVRWPGVEFRLPGDPSWDDIDRLRFWADRERAVAPPRPTLDARLHPGVPPGQLSAAQSRRDLRRRG